MVTCCCMLAGTKSCESCQQRNFVDYDFFKPFEIPIIPFILEPINFDNQSEINQKRGDI